MNFEQLTAPFLSLTAVFKSHICKQQSFANIGTWKTFMERSTPPSVHKNVVLVGHKCDLNEERQITPDQGKQVADENGWLFFETSAKENINVTETFMAAARMGHRHVQSAPSVVCCHKFDSAAVFGPRWERIWAQLTDHSLALGKTKEQVLDSQMASTFAISGSKCKILDEYEGSHHILVFTPASDEV